MGIGNANYGRITCPTALKRGESRVVIEAPRLWSHCDGYPLPAVWFKRTYLVATDRCNLNDCLPQPSLLTFNHTYDLAASSRNVIPLADLTYSSLYSLMPALVSQSVGRDLMLSPQHDLRQHLLLMPPIA